MNDEKESAGKPPEDSAYGGEVETGPGGPQPRWLRFFYLALYAFAIIYMLWYAGDRWVIRVFAAALTGWAVYSFRDLFRSRRD